MWVHRWVAKCDVCGHEWLAKEPEINGDPKQCARCKSRGWNRGVSGAEPLLARGGVVDPIAGLLRNGVVSRGMSGGRKAEVVGAGTVVSRVGLEVGGEISVNPQCEECGDPLVWNRILKRWQCECSFQANKGEQI
jgi:hypothetical protein